MKQSSTYYLGSENEMLDVFIQSNYESSINTTKPAFVSAQLFIRKDVLPSPSYPTPIHHVQITMYRLLLLFFCTLFPHFSQLKLYWRLAAGSSPAIQIEKSSFTINVYDHVDHESHQAPHASCQVIVFDINYCSIKKCEILSILIESDIS